MPPMWTKYHARLHQTLKNRNLLPKHSKILIALSGGQDSLCLTRLCLDLQPKWHWQIAVAHFNHNWEHDRGLAEHVANICSSWGVEFHVVTAASTIKETEAEARRHRYQALTDIACRCGFSYLLTAHTLSDRAETFIYNLIRGAGLEGLTALNWTRRLNCHVTLVRPLLNFTRQETGDFCRQFHLPVWQDKYNQDRKFARNRIRLDLIPYLQREFNNQVEKHLAQTAEILRAELEYLEAETERIYRLVFNAKTNSIKCKSLREYPLNFQRRVIKKFLASNLSKMPNFEQIESVVRLIYAPNKTTTSTLADHMAVTVEDEELKLVNVSELNNNNSARTIES
ncbi:MAG: tRNA lysidine(34) synthetase TilS [Geminocystis sp.]|nr:tRNA lysidine(34) synthetase TilS [Geminocystis sp.]